MTEVGDFEKSSSTGSLADIRRGTFEGLVANMLIIRKEQQAEMAASLRECFLERLAEHLHDAHRELYPESTIDYSTPEAMTRLRQQMRTLIDNGIENEVDIATAIEYFELFEVDFGDQRVLEAIEKEHNTIEEKMYSLWCLRRK